MIDIFTYVIPSEFVALRGGISQCSHRYAKANNRYLDDYDEKQEESYLMYFDVNALYAYAMSQPLPIGGYEWVDVSEWTVNQILVAKEDSKYGYLLEVDVEYPKNLHDSHNDYPFLCERMTVKGSKYEKLVPNLNDKSNYVLHYLTLQMAIAQGLKLKKVHKILKFVQSKWLKPFIDFNTEKRKNAQNAFESKLYKGFSNSTYGKSIENVRKRRNVKLLNSWNGRYGAKVHIAKPNFKNLVIFNENLIAVEMFQQEILMNKPFAVGIAVLEHSKLKMYDFHYNFMLRKYDYRNCRIQYTDTDSFIYYIKGHNIYDVIKNNSKQFDTSDYSIDNIHGIKRLNKKEIGLMKDENNGMIMKVFIGLKAKMYCFKIKGGRIEKRAKGVKRGVLKNKLGYELFHDCLFENSQVTNSQATIKSLRHKLYSINTTKLMLDSKDDKRCILPNRIDTLAWGHYSISNK